MKKILLILVISIFSLFSFSQDCDGVTCVSQPKIHTTDYIECFVPVDTQSLYNECISDECIEVCEGITSNYFTPYHLGSTYNWSVIGGQILNISNSQNQITVKWGFGNSGVVRVEEIDSNLCIKNDDICIEIKYSPQTSVLIVPNNLSYCIEENIKFDAIDTNINSISQTFNYCDSNNTFWDSTQYFYSLNYYWDFGDGFTSVIKNPIHKYSSSGLKEITLVMSNNCQCSDTFSFNILITTETSPNVTSCFGVKCEGDTVQYCTDAVSSLWDVEGGTIYYSQNTDSCINVIWDNNDTSLDNGNGSVFITDLNSNCLTQNTETVPVIPLSPEIYGDTVVCPNTFETYYFECIPGVNYHWQLNSTSGIIVSGQYTSEIVVKWNNYQSISNQLTLNITSSTLECNMGQIILFIDVLPRINIYGSSSVCLNERQIYQEYSSSLFNWSVNNGTIISPLTFPFISNQIEVEWNVNSGNGSLTLTPINTNQFCDNSSTKNIIINQPSETPLGISGDTLICVNQNSQFIILESNSLSSDNSTYIWSLTGSYVNTYQGKHINVSWLSTPPFEIEVYNNNEYGCNSDTLFQIIYTTINNPIISGPNNSCMNNITSFYSNGIHSNDANFMWSVQNTNMGSVISGKGTSDIQIEWGNIGGSTNVILQVIDCGIISTILFPITITSIPITYSYSPSVLCSESIIQFTASTSTGNFIWDFGDGFIDSTLGFSVVHLYDSPGIYPITLTVTNTQNQCVSRITENIMINGINGNITPSVTSLVFCNGSNINQTLGVVTESDVNPTNIEWFLNNTSIQSSFNSNFNITDSPPVYSSLGSYSVVLTDSNGCVNTLNPINISSINCNGNVLSFSPIPYTIDCNTLSANVSVNFSSPNSNIVNWSNGVSNSTSVTETYDEAGVFTMKCYQNGVLLGAQDVTINMVVDFNYETHCDPLNNNQMSISFFDKTSYYLNNSMYQYYWDFGDGITSNLQNPIHTYINSGLSYTVTLVITNGTESCSRTSLVNSNIFTANYSYLGPFCSDNPTLNFTSPNQNIIDYQWVFGDGSSSAKVSPNRTYSNSGSFLTSLMLTDIDGCVVSSSQLITVNSSPNILSMPAIGPFCSNDIPFNLLNSVSFSNVNGETVSWSGIGIENISGAWFFNPILSGGGEFELCATITDINGCVDSKCLNVFVFCPEKPIVIGEKEYCSDNTIHMYSTQPYFTNYEWFVNGILSGSSVSYDHYGFNTVDLTVSFTDNNGCNILSEIFTVNIRTLPQNFNVLSSTNICPDQLLNLSHNGNQPGVNYSWNTTPKQISQSISIIAESNYDYYVIANNQFGCTKKSNIITVHNSPDICSVLSGCFCDSSLLNSNGFINIDGVNNSWMYTTEWKSNGNSLSPQNYSNNLFLDPSLSNYNTIVPSTFNLEITDMYGCVYLSDDLFVETNCDVCIEETYNYLYDTICSGNNYLIGSSSYNTAGVYIEPYLSSTGCDSVVELKLHVKTIYNLQNPQTICSGDFIQIGNNSYTSTGVYTDILVSQNGCDSTITTNLIVLSSITLNNNKMICTGDSLYVANNLYYQSGTYFDTLSNLSGCDSVIITTLGLNPIYLSSQFNQICTGDSIQVGSIVYSSSGLYYDTLNTVNLCDSVIFTELLVNKPVVNISSNNPLLIIDVMNGYPPYSYVIGLDSSVLINITNNIGSTFTFNPIVNGNYYVVITDSIGCISDTVFYKVDFSISTDESININNILIKPNPSVGIFRILIPETVIINRYKVVNSFGQLILSDDFENKFVNEFNVDLQSFEKGVYFLGLQNNKMSNFYKLILQ